MSLTLHETPGPGGSPPEAAAPARPRTSRRTVGLRRLAGTALVVVPVVWALVRALAPGVAVVNPGGLPVLRRLLSAVAHPALSAGFLRVVVGAAGTTLVFAALGTAAALVLGAAGALVLSDATWRHRPGPAVRAVRLIVRGLLVAMRSVHEVVWALLFVSVLGLDPLVAVLAIAVPFGAQTAKVFSEILDDVPHHALRALRAAGAGSVPALAYGLLPPAAPLLLSYSFYRFECAIRSAVVLGVVGVGGLGSEIVVSLQSRNWDEVWTLVGAIVVLSALVDVWSARVRTDLSVASCSDWTAGTVAAADRGGPTRWARWSAALIVPAVVAAWVLSGVSLGGLFSDRTHALTTGLIHEMLPPTLPRGGWGELGGAVLDTLSMAVLAMVAAVVLSLLVGPVATRVRPVAHRGRGSRGAAAPVAVARVLARMTLLVLRSVPPTVWAALALLVLFPGVLPGALALGLYTGGILGRLVAEAWESIDRRPRDALRAAGIGPATAAVAAVLPPSSRHLVTYSLYRFEICVRDTAVVGVVGAAGLGQLFAENLSIFDFPVVTTLLLASIGVSLLSEVLGRRVRRALEA
ncbi:ABC transporter permease subunit [Dermatophilaceae bacterium Soc4.6]